MPSLREYENLVANSAITFSVGAITTSAAKNLWRARRVDRDLRSAGETRAAEMSLRVARKFANQWSSTHNRVWFLSQIAVMGTLTALSAVTVCEDIAEMFILAKK